MAAEPELRWTQDEWGGDRAPGGPSLVRRVLERHGWLIHGAILLLALLLFKLTANAAVATAVSCLELGRTDFGTARWLWAVDPDRRRGRLTALCYVAGACCRVGIVAMAAACIIPVLVFCFDPPGPRVGPPQHFFGALAMMVAAFLVGAALSLWVCLAALASGRRLWLGPEPRLARRRGVWPPSRVARPSSRPPNNEVEALLLLASLLVFVPGLSLLVWICTQVPEGTVLAASLLAIPLFAIGFILGVAILKNRVFARSPIECWPFDESTLADPIVARHDRGIGGGPRP